MVDGRFGGGEAPNCAMRVWLVWVCVLENGMRYLSLVAFSATKCEAVESESTISGQVEPDRRRQRMGMRWKVAVVISRRRSSNQKDSGGAAKQQQQPWGTQRDAAMTMTSSRRRYPTDG